MIKTRHEPLEVDSENPFEGDFLRREQICKRLTGFIEVSLTPFVLVIDAKWGDGKTTFIKMWRAYLKKKSFRTVLFDAWKSDFHTEALPALTYEIKGQLNLRKLCFKRFLKRIQVNKIPKASLSTIPYIGRIVEVIFDVFKLKKNEIIENHSSYTEVIDDFKKDLRKLTSKRDKPIVIFVDELDRCRPIFALEVLEKIKHIFDVEGLFFVLALNKEVLCRTVEKEYGAIDADIYLDKFFDKVTILENNREEFIKKIIYKSGVEIDEKLRGYFSKMFLHLSDAFDLSLRTQERILNLASIMIAKQKVRESNSVSAYVFLFFAVLHVVDNSLFHDIVNLLGKDSSKEASLKTIDSLNEKLKILLQIKNQHSVVRGEVDFLNNCVRLLILELGAPSPEMDQENFESYIFGNIQDPRLEGYITDLGIRDTQGARDFLRNLLQSINLIGIDFEEENSISNT